LLWCINSVSSNEEDYLNIEKKKKDVRVISKGSQRLVFMSYLVDLQAFPIAGFCASLQIKNTFFFFFFFFFFCKWKNSKCIIKDLINHISFHTTLFLVEKKNSLVLYGKIKKKKKKNITKSFWSDVAKFQGIKGLKVRITIISNL